ncbi:ABC-type multidrug transport system fused ATPase/permease subunit [Aequitasia blattaphilus]
MIKKLQRRFALSKKGAKDTIIGSIECALQNIALMFPAGLLYMLITDLMENTLRERAYFYVGGCILSIILILVTTWFQYNGTYLATYLETGKRRISIAEKLRKIPLSFFGKKDLSDLTSAIMNDCAVLETSQSHFVCPLVGSILSTVLIAISLFFLEWRMAIAALWVLPISFGIVGFSTGMHKFLGRKAMAAKMAAEDGIQECIETMNDLRSNNAEEKVLKELEKKIRNFRLPDSKRCRSFNK